MEIKKMEFIHNEDIDLLYLLVLVEHEGKYSIYNISGSPGDQLYAKFKVFHTTDSTQANENFEVLVGMQVAENDSNYIVTGEDWNIPWFDEALNFRKPQLSQIEDNFPENFRKLSI